MLLISSSASAARGGIQATGIGSPAVVDSLAA
jgi:hypothetical protein